MRIARIRKLIRHNEGTRLFDDLVKSLKEAQSIARGVTPASRRLKVVIGQMAETTASATATIDEAFLFVDASSNRITVMERKASKD